jgi:hypothetical protein
MRTVALTGSALAVTVAFFALYTPAAPVAQMAAGIASSSDPPVTQEHCPIRGTWQLESIAVAGEVQPPPDGWRQIKLITGSHFTWVGQATGPTRLSSRADSLAAYRTTGFGAGRYTVTDSTYTEFIDYFGDPEWVGRRITFSCRVLGDRWYHSTEYPAGFVGAERTRVDEIWRRIGM